MKKFLNLGFWLIVIAALIFAAFTVYNKNKPQQVLQQSIQNTSSETGSGKPDARPTAAEISLKDLNGKIVNLSDYKGKVVILNFWASWCPPCKAEMPELDMASKKFRKGNDAIFLSINLTDGVRETAEKAKKYISDNKFSMIVLLDTEGKAANAYEIQSIPATFIIDQQGKIYDKIIGPTTQNALLKYVDLLKLK